MNIYVGNLPFTTGEEELRSTFGAYGEVASVAVIKDQFTGQSRGFGFVEMPNKDEGMAAINALNGKEIKGRALKVNEARPREERRPSGGGGGGGGYGGGGKSRGSSGGGYNRGGDSRY